MANADEIGGKGSKPRRVDRYFLNSKGEKSSRATPDGVIVVHKWRDSNFELKMPLADLNEDVIRCCAQFGLSQVIGNAYGGKEDDNDAFEAAERRWETLTTGQWETDRVIGPKPEDVVEAFAQVKAEDDGKPVSDAWRKAVLDKINAGELSTKGLLEKKKIKAKYEAIKLARAQERLKKFQQDAADSDDEALPEIAA